MTVVSKKGKFIINDQEVFLYGGEFHYFRVPKNEWEHRLDLLIKSGCNLVSTYVPWVWHEFEEGRYDFTGVTKEEKDLKGFLDLVEQKGLFCIVRPGPYVMAEVRYEGVPKWLLDKYPEVIAKQKNGEDHPTRVVSYQHPVFLEKTKQWYKEVNRIIAPKQISNGGPIIMYQLCNEIGMLHWVTNCSDFNSDTLRRYHDYLEKKYGTIDKFNETYGIREESFLSFVETFHQGLPEDYPSFHYEWRSFWREYFKEYIGVLKSFANQTGINVPYIINVHGFKDYSIYSRGVDYPIGLSQLYKSTEFSDVILAGDFYPGHIGYDNFHDLVLSCAYTKAVSDKDQPLFSAEFQSGRLADRPKLYPQDLELNTRTCVAHGMNALNYYMFIAGENYEEIGLFGRRHEWQAPVDSNGSIRPNYERAKHLGKVLGTIGKRLLNATKQVHTYIGFNPDDYMTDVVDERDQKIFNEIAKKREDFSFDGIARLLTAADIHFEAVNLLSSLDPNETPTLWVFSTKYMNPDLQKRLADYVKQGGKLVLYPEIPSQDLRGHSCTILADVLELGQWEVVSGIDYVNVAGIDSVAVKQRLRFKRYDGEPFITFTRTGNNEVAGYKKSYGDGQIIVLGIGMGHDYKYHVEVIKRIAKFIDVEPHLTASNDDISIVERRNVEESFVFVLNYDEIEQRTVVYEHGKPLYDGEEIVLAPRSGAILLRNFALTNEIIVEYATVEITDLRINRNEIQMTVSPFHSNGALKLITNQGWTSAMGEITDQGLVFKGINEETTITLIRKKKGAEI
ncbi:MAG: beta-galactosidase [Bacillaceae bacterium]|nr:beta-galactosidase [Bacillaceae bacterium]